MVPDGNKNKVARSGGGAHRRTPFRSTEACSGCPVQPIASLIAAIFLMNPANRACETGRSGSAAATEYNPRHGGGQGNSDLGVSRIMHVVGVSLLELADPTMLARSLSEKPRIDRYGTLSAWRVEGDGFDT
jgi:hypothetical protein